MVAWHLIAGQPLPHLSAVPAASPPARAQTAVPGADFLGSSAESRHSSLLPGLSLDPSFWKRRLGDLNRAQYAFERLEWKLVHSAMEGATSYVKSVVMPALAQAARARR
jgi:hypothetical protein